jgi:hypothetical protein
MLFKRTKKPNSKNSASNSIKEIDVRKSRKSATLKTVTTTRYG